MEPRLCLLHVLEELLNFKLPVFVFVCFLRFLNICFPTILFIGLIDATLVDRMYELSMIITKYLH